MNNSDVSVQRISRAIEPVNHFVAKEQVYSPQMNPINNYSAGSYCNFSLKFLLSFFLAPQPQATSPYQNNYYVQQQDVKYDRNLNGTNYASSTHNASN